MHALRIDSGAPRRQRHTSPVYPSPPIIEDHSTLLLNGSLDCCSLLLQTALRYCSFLNLIDPVGPFLGGQHWCPHWAVKDGCIVVMNWCLPHRQSCRQQQERCNQLSMV